MDEIETQTQITKSIPLDRVVVSADLAWSGERVIILI